ncbi:MAG: hypothetical protein AB7O57_00035 [Hyphomicrobiaceae bacterium]
MAIGRRRFNLGLVGAAAVGGLGLGIGHARPSRPSYRGPNVILVRFGGGVRRAETIVPATTFAPYLLNVLAARGVLLRNVTIAQLKGVATSHAEGTLNLLSGRYMAYEKVGAHGLAPLLEPKQPLLFEHLRRTFDVAPHEALVVNGEDRPQEEYLTSGGHPHFGVAFRSEIIGLYRFKLHKLARILAEAKAPEHELKAAAKELAKLKAIDYRGAAEVRSPVLERFWDSWRTHYGDSGLKNPRGDRLLTELALRALRELKPRFMMVNYQDPDYVHWGNASHYTRAIAIIDQGLARLVAAVDADPFYRNNTVFVVVPDCGRDANPLMAVPYQHHFNSRSAHEIFAVVAGPRIAKDRVLDMPVDQTSIAATIGAIMGFRVPAAEGRALAEIMT